MCDSWVSCWKNEINYMTDEKNMYRTCTGGSSCVPDVHRRGEIRYVDRTWIGFTGMECRKHGGTHDWWLMSCSTASKEIMGFLCLTRKLLLKKLLAGETIFKLQLTDSLWTPSIHRGDLGSWHSSWLRSIQSQLHYYLYWWIVPLPWHGTLLVWRCFQI